MKEYQSFGVGVNSVALSEILDSKVERVFSDPGGEYPETYDYIDYWKSLEKQLTILKPSVQGHETLESYCRFYKTAPMKKYRWCTDKFKVQPLIKHYQKPCIVNVGIAYDERHRIKIYEAKGIKYRYPLVSRKITRKGCIEIIKDAGLKVPVKSGCYFCPFQPKVSWHRLARQHPDLFWKAVEIDELSDKINLYYKGLRRLYPPPMVFSEPEEGWECQFCFTFKEDSEK